MKSQDERFDKPKPAELANSLPTPIKNIPDIAQPYSQKIFGIDTCIIVNNDYFSISVVDKSKKNWYFVNDKELEFAKTLENYFLKIGLDKYLTYEGQKEYGRYLNRNNYPEIFDE